MFVFSLAKWWGWIESIKRKYLRRIFCIKKSLPEKPRKLVDKLRMAGDWRWTFSPSFLPFFDVLLLDGFKIFAYFPSHRLRTLFRLFALAAPSLDKLPFVCESIEYVTQPIRFGFSASFLRFSDIFKFHHRFSVSAKSVSVCIETVARTANFSSVNLIFIEKFIRLRAGSAIN